MGYAQCSPRIVQAANGERNRHIHLGARLHGNARDASRPAPEAGPRDPNPRGGLLLSSRSDADRPLPGSHADGDPPASEPCSADQSRLRDTCETGRPRTSSFGSQP